MPAPISSLPTFTKWCQCDYPIIRCDNRGCYCDTCGWPERLNLDFGKPKWSKPTVNEVPYSPRMEEHMRDIFTPSKEFVLVHAEY